MAHTGMLFGTTSHQITNYSGLLQNLHIRRRGPLHAQRKTSAMHHLVAWIGGAGALSPTRVPGHAMRTYSGRPSSSIRFSTSAAMATSVACRPSVWKRSPAPTTRFHREISDSTRARQPYPGARCQPMRPRSAMHRRCISRCVGAVSAASLGTAFARGGTTTAAAGWRATTSAKDAKVSIDRIRAVMHHFRGEPGSRRSIAPSRKLWTALQALDRYLVGQSERLVDYGERHRAGLRVGTALTV